jgi:hypothetical protein
MAKTSNAIAKLFHFNGRIGMNWNSNITNEISQLCVCVGSCNAKAKGPFECRVIK